MPVNLVLSHWLEVKKSKQREINQQSYTSSHIASFIYNYLKGEDAQPLELSDFLPFREQVKEGYVLARTARIFLDKMEDGLIPPNILADIKGINDGDLMKNLLELGKQSRSR